MMIYITNVSSFTHLVQIAYERRPTGTGSLCTLLFLMTSVNSRALATHVSQGYVIWNLQWGLIWLQSWI